MATTLRKKVARIALACLLALSCFSATSITTLVSAHGDRSVAYAADAWKKSGNRWWYQTGNSYAKGWKQIDGKWYYFDSNGWMQTGWQKIGDTWYYLDNSGVMAADKWVGNYYLTKSGSMATNTWVGSYWVGSDGAWMPNKTKGTWKKSSGKWWYAKSGSSYAIGWEKIDSSWYYFDSAGWMKTGWQKVGGNWYYLQGSGAMVTGWNRVSGTWYYHNNSGAMLTGWQSINGAWYYLESSGAMAADKWVGDYYLTSSGAMATNQWIGDYWVGPDGKWDPNETFENSIYLNPENYPTYGDVDYSSDADMYDDAWTPESDNAVTVAKNATAATNAKPGDVVVFMPTNENPTGSALKVTNITTQGSETRIEGTTPELSEVVDSIRATGVTNQFVSLQLADGVTMSNATSGQVLASDSASYGLFDINTSNALTLDTFGLDGKIIDKDGLQLTLDPQIYYDIDYRNGELRTCTAIAKVNAQLNYEMKVSEQYETKLFSATIVIPEALGLTMNMDFYLTASATGSVELEGRLTSAAGIVYSNGVVQTVSSKGFSYFANFDADVRTGLAPRIGFNVFGVIPLAQVDAEIGVGVAGRFTDHNGFQCADLNAYVYADVYLNRKSNALGEALDLLDQPTEFHPLTKSNGSVDRIHVENGVVVPKCTWGSGGSGSDQPSGDVIATYDENAGIPEIEDNGYGNEPKLDEDGGYYNHLVEPFNVYAGQSVTINGKSLRPDVIGNKPFHFRYDCAPGTVYKIKGETQWGDAVDDVSAFAIFGSRSDDNTVWTIEVYCGRIDISEIVAWSAPEVSIGACETISYPLQISATNLQMRVGQKYQLAAEHAYDPDDKRQCGFMSSNESVVRVAGRSGELEAVGAGTAVVTVTYGELWTRTCTITVS